MKAVIFCAIFGCFVVVVYSAIPAGFQPITPLPGQNFFGGKTQKAKPTQKPTQKPTKAWKPTQKPVITKSPPPAVTKAPPTPLLPSTVPKNCRYNINVPQANCNGGNSAVQQTLNDLKQQLDKARQQHQAQNSAVQSMITKLQGQQAGYLTRISDLQNEVRNLIYAFNALNNNQAPSSTTPPARPTTQPNSAGSIPSAALLQAIQNVRHDMGQTVNDFNSKLLNLTLQIQANQLQDSRLHTTVESQIQNQARDIGRLTQQVTDLNRILQQLNSISGQPTNGSGGATSTDVAKLQAQIQQVAADLKQYDTKQQSQLNSLNQKTANLQSTVSGHTSDINNLKSGSALVNSRINTVQKNITLVHDALAQFRQVTNPKMNQLSNDVNSLKTKTNKLENDATSIGKSVASLAASISVEKAQLQSLDTQTNILKNETRNLQKSVTDQGTELLNVKLGLIKMKNIVPDLKSMNNVILSVINKGGNPNTQQLKDINDAINKIVNKLNQIKLNPASG